MVERVDFYHLHARSASLDQALALLLSRTLASGERALVKAGSSSRVDHLDSALWTFEAGSWLPHGTTADGFAESQPVYLTTGDENPNGATFLFLIDGAWRDDLTTFQRIFILFDERDEISLTAARSRWRQLRDSGCALRYWQQNESRRWEEKASENTGSPGA